MTMHKALHPIDDIDRSWSPEKKEGNSLALKIALIHHYEDSKATLKRAKTNYCGQ